MMTWSIITGKSRRILRSRTGWAVGMDLPPVLIWTIEAAYLFPGSGLQDEHGDAVNSFLLEKSIYLCVLGEMNRKTCIASLFLVVLGCDNLRYDAPPEAKLAVPEGGVYNVGEPLILTFSEPVVEESLAVRVWFASRDIEQELELEGEPLLARCTPSDEEVSRRVRHPQRGWHAGGGTP